MLIVLLVLFATSVLAQSNSALRDPKQVAAFKRANPCPATNKIQLHCPGYVVDHRWPLCAGGEDNPPNMQWQTIAEAKKKDVLEIKLCRLIGTAG